jgi:hypothetical protein
MLLQVGRIYKVGTDRYGGVLVLVACGRNRLSCHLVSTNLIANEHASQYMQTIIHIYCTPGLSIREAITRDKRLKVYMFEVGKVQQPGRAPGWLKLYSTEADGALNIEWDATAAVLKCRVVNRREGKPKLIVADFLEYILARFRKRVMLITILPE